MYFAPLDAIVTLKMNFEGIFHASVFSLINLTLFPCTLRSTRTYQTSFLYRGIFSFYGQRSQYVRRSDLVVQGGSEEVIKKIGKER